MGNKIRPSKKRKAATVALTSVLASMPFVAGTPFELNVSAYETEPTLVDEMSNLVVPLSDTLKIIDLKSILGTYASNFEITSSDPRIAGFEASYQSAGLLKIHPGSVGTATFTINYRNDGARFKEVFDVTVDALAAEPRSFNIVDTVQKMIADPSHYTDAASVKNLLSTIGPAKIPGTTEGNHPPFVNQTNPFHDQDLTIGEEIDLNSLASYFTDPDEGDIISVSSSAVNVEGDHAAELQAKPPGMSIKANRIGITEFTITATDNHGNSVVLPPFTVSVQADTQNHVPVFTLNGQDNPFKDRTIQNGTLEMDLGVLEQFFTDPDEDPITLSVTTDHDHAELIRKVDNRWYLKANTAGETIITVTANDNHGGSSIPLSFRVKVNGAPILQEGHSFTNRSTIEWQFVDLGRIEELFTDPNADPITVEKVSSNPEVADIVDIEGTLRLRSKEAGTATLTVTAKDNSGGIGEPHSFQVTVRENHSPVLVLDGLPNPFVDRTIEQTSGEISLGILEDYFIDEDEDSISLDIVSDNNNVKLYRNEDNHNWYIKPISAGETTFTVRGMDNYGGYSEAETFKVTVSESPGTPNHAPALNVGNELVKHFSNDASNPDYDPSVAALHLSGGSEIDLSEIFIDPEADEMHYKVKIVPFSGSVYEMPVTGSILKSSVVNSSSVIREIQAYDAIHQDPTILKVQIDNKNTLFPEINNEMNDMPQVNNEMPQINNEMDMYESNAAGTSSFILDINSYWGLGSDKTLLSAKSSNVSSVTAAVYENYYLKFDAAVSGAGTSSSMKILSASFRGYDWYQNDFKINVISPSSTPEDGTSKPAISFKHLYPAFDANTLAGNFFNYLTVTTVSEITYETGGYTMRISDAETTHTNTIFIIDPEKGTPESESREFIVPFVKPTE
ncbi:hypothetical protein [Paenibacillus alba]|uniref:Uncharacterized protein n=1 Tax=Paenibacillus alba TaxID=1197127 RepID=A0ABU6G4D2_9BACL|nr:hypothetical protein [Paenibacillus alba]MEC0229001.1 hypothetical protein [Paenibacillus alba]